MRGESGHQDDAQASCLNLGDAPRLRSKGLGFLAWMQSAALVLIFLAVISLGGYSAATPTALCFSVLIIKRNSNRGLALAIIYACLFLTLFDNASFIFKIAGLNGFRLSYTFLLIFESMWAIAFLRSLRLGRSIKISNLIVGLFVGVFLFESVVFFLREPVEANLYSVKYWIFTFLPMISIPKYFSETRDDDFLAYFILLTQFVCLFGLAQFIARLWGDSRFISPEQYAFANNPIAFFSERTWYGLMATFGIAVLMYLRESHAVGALFYAITFALFLLAVILSLSRNAYLGTALCLCLGALPNVRQTLKTLGLFVAIICGLFAASHMATSASSILTIPSRSASAVWAAFVEGNQSGTGRLENLDTVVSRYEDGTYSIWGNGFSWNSETEGATGGAMGAKSNNVLFFVFHIFGLQGLVLILSLMLRSIFRAGKGFRQTLLLKYALIMMLMWVGMAQFAPLHQYGIGVMIFCVIAGMYMKGLRLTSSASIHANRIPA